MVMFFYVIQFSWLAIRGNRIRSPRIEIEGPSVRNDFHARRCIRNRTRDVCWFSSSKTTTICLQTFGFPKLGSTYQAVRIFPSFHSRRYIPWKRSLNNPVQYLCACACARNDKTREKWTEKLEFHTF